MAKIYLAAPFFSDGQHDRINQVKEALEANKTVSSIFVPEEHSYEHAEFGSLEWQKATFTLDINNIYTADAVVAIIKKKRVITKLILVQLLKLALLLVLIHLSL